MNQVVHTNSKLNEYDRTLILFESVEKGLNQITEFFNSLLKNNKNKVKGVISSSDSLFIKTLRDHAYNLNLLSQIDFVSMQQINVYLGSTLDFIVLDLRETFSPNSLISLIETIRGGGIIVIIGNERKFWIESVNKKYLPFSQSSNLLEWFLANISKNSGCIIDTEGTQNLISFFNPMPFGVNLTKNIIGIPVTLNQNEVIKSLVSNLREDFSLISTNIVIADRGRGKSAAVGLSIAKSILENHQIKYRIIITSRDISHTQTIFTFISRSLTINNINHRIKRDREQIIRIDVFKRCFIEFRQVGDITIDTKCNILVVDEAAAFPQEKLLEIIGMKAKKVFISTIHGYEGAGRSFQYKILDHIQRRYKGKYSLFKLTEPIRYLIGDPIESLINETFFLKLKRVKIESVDQINVKNDTHFETYSDSSQLFSDDNRSLLEEMMRILIYAHYRNQPNDLLLIADSNQHFLGNLSTTDLKGKNQILLSCQLAIEGMIDPETVNSIVKGKYIDGNLIPSIAIRHFSPIFAQLRGIRIVRIASHPDFTNKGFGRVTIEKLLIKYQNHDWIGVSCGATLKLVKFWKKFGFNTIHMRPTKSSETGEWNIVLVNPISEVAKKLINEASRNFALQFIYLLRHSLFEIKPELAIVILRSCANVTDYEVKMTQSGKYRLKRYIEGNLNFLLTVDVLQELVVCYFVIPLEIQLSSSQEILLMSRILQGRTWGQTLHKTGLKWKEANALLQKAILRIAKHMMLSDF